MVDGKMDAGGQEWRGQQGWIVLSVSLERRAHVVDLIVCAPSEMLERACVRAAPPEYQAEVELPFMSELPRAAVRRGVVASAIG